ncbi:MAG: ribosome silencing factor [Dehalococcoidia bacterium]|nr:ribosome silencing factor [Dehalococcoidia bacterium]
MARQAVEAAGEKQAADILLLDVREVCTFASYFVICSGESERQLKAIGEEVEQTLKKSGERILHEEGTADSGWMLYDYGDVVVHIFSPAERNYYQFDELWSKGKTIVRIQ